MRCALFVFSSHFLCKAVRPSAQQLASLHSSNVIIFSFWIWLLSVKQWAFVVDYAKTYREDGLHRVYRAYQLLALLLLLGFPLGFASIWSAPLIVLGTLTAIVLFLPGFRRILSVAHLCLALMTPFQIRADLIALKWIVASHPHVGLPFVTLLAFATIILTMFVFRAALVAASASNQTHAQGSLPAFFDAKSLAICALRSSAWICAAALDSSTVSNLFTAVLIFVALWVSNSSSLRAVAAVLVKSVIPGTLVSALVVAVFWSFSWVFPVLLTLSIGLLSSISGNWFDSDVILRANLFQSLILVSFGVAFLGKALL